MSYSYTTTSVRTFSLTSAQHIASKVAADLRRLNSYYARPTEIEINNYYEELTVMLVGEYLQSVEYGFQKNGARIISLRYDVQSDGTLTDVAPGAVYARAGASIEGAAWFSFLTTNQKWDQLSEIGKANFKKDLKIQRTVGNAPVDGSGYWETTRSYSADGVGVQRKMFRPL